MRYWNTMTRPQQQSCLRLWKQHPSIETYFTFRRRFHEYDGSGTIRNRVGSYFGGFMPAGLFIGIETDGYAHS